MCARVLITGSSGFIGFHVSRYLLDLNCSVVGIDNLNDYYSVELKKDRESILDKYDKFQGIRADIQDGTKLQQVFKEFNPEYVVHLAAQAGVRNSIANPRSYMESNIQGSFELFEAAKNFPPEHILCASTSSVYGGDGILPFSECDKADEQLSMYAATKKAMESLAHSYAYIHGLNFTMFRFFTVYGPWGRPDMALFKFTENIVKGEPINVFNNGMMKRDFTYVTDLVKCIYLLLEKAPKTMGKYGTQSNSSVAPYRIVNIGNSKPIGLMEYIKTIEHTLNQKANINYMPMQLGDVKETSANNDFLRSLIGYVPDTDINAGVKSFIDWYKRYYV